MKLYATIVYVIYSESKDIKHIDFKVTHKVISIGKLAKIKLNKDEIDSFLITRPMGPLLV